MPVGRPPSISRRDSSEADAGSLNRRQSITGAISGFAAELRARPKKSSLTLSRFTGKGKSTDDLSLASAAARSKSCSHLPVTGSSTSTDAYSATGSSNEPLLTLVLASTSFLDTTISDSTARLYVVDTRGTRTNISREDPIQGIAHVGIVDWKDESVRDEGRPITTLGPKRHTASASATIQMAHGRRYHVEDFLRRTRLTSFRIFNIPHYPKALKWKRSGGSYKLTVVKSKTTIAIFEPAVQSAQSVPARIKVFDPLYEHDVTSPLREHRGVPVILLDYLIVTSLLISAEKDESLLAAVGRGSGGGTPTIGVHGSIHRWRMEVQPEQPEELEEQELEPMAEEGESASGSGSRPSTPERMSASASAVTTEASVKDVLSDSVVIGGGSVTVGTVVTAASASATTIGKRLGLMDRRASSSQHSLRRPSALGLGRGSGLGLASRYSNSNSDSNWIGRNELFPSSPQSMPTSMAMTVATTPSSASTLMFPRSPRSPALSETVPGAIPTASTVSFATATATHHRVPLATDEDVEVASTTAVASCPLGERVSESLEEEDGSRDRDRDSRRSSSSRHRASRSLPASPTIVSDRPSTASANPGAGRRRFRPLPRLPAHAGTLPARYGTGYEQVPPVPRLPAGAPSELGSSIHIHSSEGATADAGELRTMSTSIHRTTSDATLSAKFDSGTTATSNDTLTPAPIAVESEAGEEQGDDPIRDRDSSLLKKTLYTRRSIYKEPLPSPSPSPAPSTATTTTNTTTTTMTNTTTAMVPLDRSQTETPVSMTVRPTAPLRIRHPRPVTASAGHAHTAYAYDAIPRASTSSSSHTQPHSTHPPAHHHVAEERMMRIRRHGVDEEGDSDGDGNDEDDDEFERGAPPAYDTIDFSHPPLKTALPGPGRGVGLG